MIISNNNLDGNDFAVTYNNGKVPKRTTQNSRLFFLLSRNNIASTFSRVASHRFAWTENSFFIPCQRFKLLDIFSVSALHDYLLCRRFFCISPRLRFTCTGH